jgi:putative exporter of polyketide antibiotics
VSPAVLLAAALAAMQRRVAVYLNGRRHCGASVVPTDDVRQVDITKRRLHFSLRVDPQ